MFTPKKRKIEEKKESEVRKLSLAQLELLESFIAPIGEGSSLEKALESAGPDIQIVLEHKEIDPFTKMGYLQKAIEDPYFLSKQKDNKDNKEINGDVVTSLIKISDFCLDRLKPYRIEGFGLYTHDQTRSTSQHYLWALSELSPFKNLDDASQKILEYDKKIEMAKAKQISQPSQMTKEEEELAKQTPREKLEYQMSKAMQSAAQKMVAKNIFSLGKAEMLYVAAKVGDINEVKALLEAKANPSISFRRDGKTPLMIAAQNGHKEIVETLIEVKADLEVVDEFGRSALWTAAVHGLDIIVETLIEAKANIETVNGQGTPICAAVRAAKTKTVETLIEAKANLSITVGQKTLLDIANISENSEMIELVRVAMEKQDQSNSIRSRPV